MALIFAHTLCYTELLLCTWNRRKTSSNWKRLAEVFLRSVIVHGCVMTVFNERLICYITWC